MSDTCECVHVDPLGGAYAPGEYPPDVFGGPGTPAGPATPKLTSVTPNTGIYGEIVNLTFTGTGFIEPYPLAPCKMHIDYGTPLWASLDATWVSDTEVTTMWMISSSDEVELRIGTGDVYSNPLPFTITEPGPASVLTSLSPASITTLDTLITIVVAGSGFERNSMLFMNGALANFSYVSDTEMTIIANGGFFGPSSVQVEARTNGATSNALTLTVT